MATVEIEPIIDTEDERVLRWRSEELKRGGYDAPAVALLAGRNDVDLHTAVELLRGGCPHEVALQILL